MVSIESERIKVGDSIEEQGTTWQK